MFKNIIPILVGGHSDFTSAWYRAVGAQMCLTLSIQVFSVHASYLFKPMLSSCLRCCDRGCKTNMRKYPEVSDQDPKYDEPNTKKLL